MVTCNSLPLLKKGGRHVSLQKTCAPQSAPTGSIAFIHDAETDTAKKPLFDAVNAGRVRVLLGSTEKMDARSNVHMRLGGRATLSSGKATQNHRKTAKTTLRSWCKKCSARQAKPVGGAPSAADLDGDLRWSSVR